MLSVRYIYQCLIKHIADSFNSKCSFLQYIYKTFHYFLCSLLFKSIFVLHIPSLLKHSKCILLRVQCTLFI